MKPKILMTMPMGRTFEKRVSERLEPVALADLKDHKGVRVVLVNGAYRADKAMMDSFPDLGLIACFGSGFDSVDVPEANARGIKVSNSAGANAAAVADLTVGLVLSSIRFINKTEGLLRAGKWHGEKPVKWMLAKGLTGRNMGIVGMGAIGRKIASRLAAFETNVGYYNRSRKDDLSYPYFNSVLELAEWAHVLILAHRADETNRNIVDAQVLKALGPEGHLVNISRGSALDEDVLMKALEDGTIAGAALDVFHNEPNVRADLLATEKTVLTPHIAGGTSQAFYAMYDALYANIDAFLDGKPLPNEVVV